jgi:hypothetical protein
MSVHWEDTNVKTRVTTVLLAVLAGLAVLSGCSSDNAEHARVVADVQSVNEGAPLIAAYVDVGGDGVEGGTDDSYPIDAVPVIFTARPYIEGLSASDAGGAYSSFIITAYDLTWEGASVNAPAGLADHNVVRGATQLQVPLFDQAELAVMIADRTLKDAVMTPGNDFKAIARLTFYGHDSGSEAEVAVRTALMVNFIWAVTNR